MKILFIHNFYQSSAPSGEDIVFKNEVELLKKNGINVVTYEKYNDEIKEYGFFGKFTLPFKNIWSVETYRELKLLIKKEKPDIAHFHNIWYLISPFAYYACKEEGIPVIQTLHNYRIFCTSGLLFRNNKICEECITGNKFKIIKNSLKYGCYRNSRIYSLPIAFAEYFHWIKQTWINKVDAYIALTEFSRNKFIEAGLPSDKIFVKPNFLTNPPEPNYSHQNYACFIGRISQEKGIDILIEAFKSIDNYKLKVVGDGKLRDQLELKIKKEKINNIEFLGMKNHSETITILKNAMFSIIPSIGYENFPLVLIESFASGKPVIASKLGPLAELIEDKITGLLFEPGNSNDLSEKIKWMFENEDLIIQMGKNARAEFEEKYTAEKNLKILLNIYSQVISNAK
jgi:glycosyltransferase involved in cell wall biosynthesis